jgi:hypothetical protein
VNDLIRHFASDDGGFRGSDKLFPGDSLTQRDQVRRLRSVRDQMHAAGFPVHFRDSHGYAVDAPSFDLETGHHVGVGLSRQDQGWVMNVWHPGDDRATPVMVHVNLGTRDEEVPRLVQRELGCRHVTREMAGQMRGTGEQGPRRRRGTMQYVHHDAEGVALRGSGEER